MPLLTSKASGPVSGMSEFARLGPQADALAPFRHARNPKDSQPPPNTKSSGTKAGKEALRDYKSRVKNVKLTMGSPPKVALSHDENLIHLTLDSYLVGSGEADVEGKDDCDGFQFGFIQLCRPFDMERIVYGSRHTPGFFMTVDRSSDIRSGEPALDVFKVGDIFSYHSKPACNGTGKTFHAKVDFSDKPSTGLMMPTPALYTQGIAWQNFFFTTFSVIYPDGSVQHLKSFYWEIQFCLQIDPPTAANPDGKVKSKTADVKVGDPIDGAPSEPGLNLMGHPAKTTCNALVKGTKSKVEVTNAPVSC